MRIRRKIYYLQDTLRPKKIPLFPVTGKKSWVGRSGSFFLINFFVCRKYHIGLKIHSEPENIL